MKFFICILKLGTNYKDSIINILPDTSYDQYINALTDETVNPVLHERFKDADIYVKRDLTRTEMILLNEEYQAIMRMYGTLYNQYKFEYEQATKYDSRNTGGDLSIDYDAELATLNTNLEGINSEVESSFNEYLTKFNKI